MQSSERAKAYALKTVSEIQGESEDTILANSKQLRTIQLQLDYCAKTFDAGFTAALAEVMEAVNNSYGLFHHTQRATYSSITIPDLEAEIEKLKGDK